MLRYVVLCGVAPCVMFEQAVVDVLSSRPTGVFACISTECSRDSCTPDSLAAAISKNTRDSHCIRTVQICCRRVMFTRQGRHTRCRVLVSRAGVACGCK